MQTIQAWDVAITHYSTTISPRLAWLKSPQRIIACIATEFLNEKSQYVSRSCRQSKAIAYSRTRSQTLAPASSFVSRSVPKLYNNAPQPSQRSSTPPWKPREPCDKEIFDKDLRIRRESSGRWIQKLGWQLVMGFRWDTALVLLLTARIRGFWVEFLLCTNGRLADCLISCASDSRRPVPKAQERTPGSRI